MRSAEWKIDVYGSREDRGTRQTLTQLHSLRILPEFHNTDEEPAARAVAAMRAIDEHAELPRVYVRKGRGHRKEMKLALFRPSGELLRGMLRYHGVIK